MSTLQSGRYYILPFTASGTTGLPVGAVTDQSPSPVVVGGGDRLWTLEQLENGNYILSLDQFTPRFSEISGGDIVVNPDAPAQEWWINERSGDTYTIEVAGMIGWPIRAWTVANIDVDTEVKIGVYEFPGNVSRWVFQRLIE